MVIFYEGCRIIKLNEQATFSRHDGDGSGGGVTVKTDMRKGRA